MTILKPWQFLLLALAGHMNRQLNDTIETVFLVPKDEYIYLSSRLVKEVFYLGGRIEGLVPEAVLGRLAEAHPD